MIQAILVIVLDKYRRVQQYEKPQRREASIGLFLSILDLLGCWQLVESLIPPLLELLPANETALDDSGLGGEYLPQLTFLSILSICHVNLSLSNEGCAEISETKMSLRVQSQRWNSRLYNSNGCQDAAVVQGGNNEISVLLQIRYQFDNKVGNLSVTEKGFMRSILHSPYFSYQVKVSAALQPQTDQLISAFVSSVRFNDQTVIPIFFQISKQLRYSSLLSDSLVILTTYKKKSLFGLLIVLYLMNKTNKDLIKALIYEGVIKNMEVAKAMQAVDRKYYAPSLPYIDSPQSIGYGATISAPHMHAYALEYLAQKLKVAKYVLDVGSGTGYLTAAMAYLVSPQSQVCGVQHVPQLAKKSLQSIEKSNPELLPKVKIQAGDGRLGWLLDKSRKFDAIHVGAAAQKMPLELCQQLAEGGVMLIPVGGQDQIQKFLQITKKEGKLHQKALLSVRYVPLTDLKKQTH